MGTIYLVTGNQYKRAEFMRLLPADMAIETVDYDLPEIQSLDLKAIVSDKVRRAYERLQKPVLVEDVSAGLDQLGGLPGPFIKFFEQSLGSDALYKLAGHTEAAATVTCMIAYYDGEHMLIAEGVVHGTVQQLVKDNGFGFDGIFVPAGQSKTYGDMTPEQKDSLSHRALAVRSLLQQLRAKL